MSPGETPPPAIQAHPLLNQWVRVGPGQQLTVFTGKT